MTRTPHYLLLIPLLLAGAACSSDPEPAPAQTGGAGSGGTNAAGSNAGGESTLHCPEGTNPQSDANLVDVGLVTGLIVDENGDPTSAGLVQVCGKDVCTQANVGDNGKLSESVGDTRDTPAVKFGNGFEWAKLTLPLAAGDNELGTLTTVRLPDYADAAALTPGRLAASGGVTLTLAKGARVDMNFLDYETEDVQGFRAAALPDAALSQLGQGFALGFALSPLETKICPRPALSLENTANLPVGTELELYLLGLDVSEEFAPYTAWQKVGEGAVSDDGATLDFPEGVPVLTAIGVKVKE